MLLLLLLLLLEFVIEIELNCVTYIAYKPPNFLNIRPIIIVPYDIEVIASEELCNIFGVV